MINASNLWLTAIADTRNISIYANCISHILSLDAIKCILLQRNAAPVSVMLYTSIKYIYIFMIR